MYTIGRVIDTIEKVEHNPVGMDVTGFHLFRLALGEAIARDQNLPDVDSVLAVDEKKRISAETQRQYLAFVRWSWSRSVNISTRVM